MTQRTKDTLIPNLLRISQLAGIIGLIFMLGKREHLIETIQVSDANQDQAIKDLVRATADLTTTVMLHEFKLMNVRSDATDPSSPFNFGLVPFPHTDVTPVGFVPSQRMDG